MAFSFSEKFVIHCFFSLLITCFRVEAILNCPPDKGSDAAKDRGMKLADDGQFVVQDTEKKYTYKINLCQKDSSNIAIAQEENVKNGLFYVVGYYTDMTLIHGTDWMMITYFGKEYKSHCGNKKRQGIVFISCDESADTHAKRKPKILREYAPKGTGDEFCYYLFEMNHSGVCPAAPKTKISPGSVFIIIIVIIGVLYLVLGLLYQRFIVGAKGLEQIPNYLMWREFGTLQADGCNFMCRCHATQQPTRYKPVDDAIADDAEPHETDDTLLPM